MQQMIRDFLNDNTSALKALLKELCLIPAPSHAEDARAAFCKKWLTEIGAEGVYIDEAKNVIFPLHCENSNAITVIAAHTDTVFPDTSPMPYREENGRIYSPGVGDDTASLAVMMTAVKFFVQNRIVPRDGLLFVCNSCEEGLGNLYGTRTLMQEYHGRIKQFVSFDSSKFSTMYTTCVGSHRYEVEALTAGGHSFSAFGKRSAVLSLAEMISAIYSIELPQKAGTKTTFNVGTIEGGTSVNTIPQNAKMLCEYRSNDLECLEYMKEKFRQIFESANCEHTKVVVTQVGDRPCAGNVNAEHMATLRETCRRVIEETTKASVKESLASTDCNIPLSLGIPAVCIGTYRGAGAHTREEYIEEASLPTGLEIAIKVIAALGEMEI